MRLLSATAFMKFSTAAEAVIGRMAPAAGRRRRRRSAASEQGRRRTTVALITGRSLASVSVRS